MSRKFGLKLNGKVSKEKLVHLGWITPIEMDHSI